MSSFLFSGGRFLDPRRGELLDGVEVLIEGERVKEISDRPIKSTAATPVALAGRTLMPGLIDAHLHVFLNEVNIGALDTVPLTLLAINGSLALKASLMRGFTSVRDTAGGDFGIKSAVEQGLIEAPRLFISGQALSQTGGHGDFRKRTQRALGCDCCSGLAYTARIADGVPEVIKATRDELRKGADFIKIMVSGGVASQADPLESLQYRMDEIQAAVEEATNWGKYVAAHAYSSQAVMRAVSAGVRTIEHGNLIDEPTAATMARKGAFLVPTLIAYDSMRRRGRDYGLSEYSLQKNEVVLAAGLRSVELARNAGVKIGFGTDLLGQLQNDQCREFLIRAELMKPAEIIHSATIVNAEILQRAGELGELVPGAFADLIVVDGDPLADLNLFQDEGRHLSAIMKGGRFYKNRLAS
ncbi:MAG: amidohydrolase family protein [Hyphomicrobiales bacterium]|nr:amidohydrolase family protein [Hyphomicrobiales bacterium]MBV8827199.1 amidohydrolase family protein [Hyphomicrobiales bacterium]MBV9430176.1 amidohydrolase family protein [Bradyrhizobiaceae bacterium]